MYPTPLTSAARGFGDLSHSALPDAPVVPERTRPQPLTRARAALATALHTAAWVVEPRPARRAATHREVCA